MKEISLQKVRRFKITSTDPYDEYCQLKEFLGKSSYVIGEPKNGQYKECDIFKEVGPYRGNVEGKVTYDDGTTLLHANVGSDLEKIAEEFLDICNKKQEPVVQRTGE